MCLFVEDNESMVYKAGCGPIVDTGIVFVPLSMTDDHIEWRRV